MVTFPVETPAQRAVLGVAFTFSILAVIAVCLRLLAHHIAQKKWTASDYFIIIACIFCVGLQSISITGVIQAGIGFDHTVAIATNPAYGPGPITKLLQLIIPLQFLWVLSLSCSKISILFLYLRIFPVRWLVLSSWATITIIVAWAIATILAGCLICRPFAYNWDQTIPGGKCGDQVTSFTVTGVVNLVTDVIVLVLPMRSLYKLQMATYKKVTLIAVFGLGIVTCIISALRISVLSTMDFADITYTIPQANIFSGIEPCLAVILASVPMMRPLLGRAGSTPDATGRTPVSSSMKKSGTGAKGSRTGTGDEDGFERLDDDTSQLWLRPMGGKHYAGISVRQHGHGEDGVGGSGGSMESLENGPGAQRERSTSGGRGITVKQEWAVEERIRR
ncbi:hypothetical protein BJX63DRAFT_443261 [Aspergillus granulosus]|uniref:Rhodopsin domain-containing protein n=1 Tax=Aspergillus granulosus TaxID=176169 RepID=A0ABR4HC87_9EURO